MSVLIKGMEMPKKCSLCPFRNAFSIVCSLTHMRLDRDNFFQCRDERCPLVEVPTPHGRLIDAGTLLTERRKSKYYHLTNGDIAIPVIDIEHAPTVIEAEEKG